MMTPVASQSPGRRPLMAQDLGTARSQSMASHPAVQRLGTKIAAIVERILVDHSRTMPRVSVEQITSQGANPDLEDNEHIFLNGSVTSPGFRILLDRPAVFAICESLLGGDGSEEPVTDQERPISAIERDLCTLLATRVSGAVVKLIADESSASEASASGGSQRIASDTSSSELSVLLLVTISGYSGQMRVFMPGADVAKAIAQSDSQIPRTRGDPGEWRARMLAAPVCIDVFLQPSSTTMSGLMALAPSQRLALTATFESPVQLHAAGQLLFHGRLQSKSGKLVVRILPEPVDAGAPVQQETLST